MTPSIHERSRWIARCAEARLHEADTAPPAQALSMLAGARRTLMSDPDVPMTPRVPSAEPGGLSVAEPGGLSSAERDAVRTTWYLLITDALAAHGESWDTVESHTLAAEALDRPFDASTGAYDPDGADFTLWTTRSVYFPLQYDGAKWVGRVARHPDGQPTAPLGGG